MVQICSLFEIEVPNKAANVRPPRMPTRVEKKRSFAFLESLHYQQRQTFGSRFSDDRSGMEEGTTLSLASMLAPTDGSAHNQIGATGHGEV